MREIGPGYYLCSIEGSPRRWFGYMRAYLTCRSKLLAQRLNDSLDSPEDKSRIEKSGELLPTVSLKFRETRDKLAWVRDLGQEKYLTVKRVKEALRQLPLLNDLSFHNLPGFSYEEWLKQQSVQVTKVLQRARKSVAVAAMANPDNMETQVWGEEDCVFVVECGIYRQGLKERLHS